ncbi:LytR family transcriptional regulator, partial [Streptomyces sp. NPDC006129]
KLISFAMSLKDIDLHNTEFVTVPWRYEGSRVPPHRTPRRHRLRRRTGRGRGGGGPCGSCRCA